MNSGTCCASSTPVPIIVLGRELFGRWADWQKALPVVKGDEIPADERDAWEWLRNPLPPASEDALFATLRLQLGLPDQAFFTDRGFGSLGFLEQQAVGQALAPGFLREHNPDRPPHGPSPPADAGGAGLLERSASMFIPTQKQPADAYPGVGFSGLGLLTNHPFDLAYQAAEAFTAALQKRTKAAGFMKTLLLQRICSSFASGRSTAEKMLRREMLEDEEQAKLIEDALSALTPEEAKHLRTIVEELSRPEARDPKVAAVRYFLTEHRTEGKTWLEHGCIVFSQYYDTAYSLAAELAKSLPGEPVGVYAGAGKSGMFRGGDFASVEREDIKKAVKKREIRLVVATDAACEGLNLQTLGTLINVDLPWNPSRLEQRLGRIKRFGQARRTVDMLNLVYHDTQDEKVYEVISRRMKDRYDIFGGLPDTIEDDWIETVEELEDMMDDYIHLRRKARDVFELRYQETIDPDKDRWELCSRVTGQERRDRPAVSAVVSQWRADISSRSCRTKCRRGLALSFKDSGDAMFKALTGSSRRRPSLVRYPELARHSSLLVGLALDERRRHRRKRTDFDSGRERLDGRSRLSADRSV